MDFYAQSDLASESYQGLKKPPVGADHSVEERFGFAVDRLEIKNDEAAHALGKPCGHYVTIDCGSFHLLGDMEREKLAHLISEEICQMSAHLCGRTPDADFSVFVAGLGNSELTTDSIGPKTVQRLTATRHLREYEQGLYREIGCSSLSSLAPGVLGQTGIETLELLQGAVKYVSPDLILVIDALAARSPQRLSSTVQITDVGIVPGSGVGNHRAALTRKSMGVEVISIGIPMVINSATLVRDALFEAGFHEIEAPLQKVLETGKSFFVSAKECDTIAEVASNILARAISLTFTGGL